MALSFGGVAVWSHNFIMLSDLRIQLPAGNWSDIDFKLIPLVTTLLTSICLSFLGFYVSAQDKMFAKSKQQIVEQFVADANKMSMKQIKKITNLKMMFIISTQSLHYLLLGGIVTGSGVNLTMCLGMWSLAFTQIDVVWNVGAICGAVAFAWVASTIALWILFRLLSLYPHIESLRLLSASVMALMIGVSHLLVQDGVNFRVNSFVASETAGQPVKNHLHIYVVFYGVLIASVAFCFMLVMVSMSDLRSWLYQLSAQNSNHELLLERLAKENPLNADIIAIFAKKHELGHGHQSHHSHLELQSQTSHSNVAGEASLLTLVKVVTCGCFLSRVSPSDESRGDLEGGLSPSRASPSKAGAIAGKAADNRPAGVSTPKTPALVESTISYDENAEKSFTAVGL